MPYCHTSLPICATFPTYHIPHDLIILIMFGKKYKFEACHYIIFSTILGTNILPSSIFSSCKVSHPYTTMGSIMILNILIFTFSDSSETMISGAPSPWDGAR
jgi:hypothetical protein